MAEYIVAIDVTRVRFPADACDCNNQTGKYPNLQVLCNNADVWGSNPRSKTPGPRESRPSPPAPTPTPHPGPSRRGYCQRPGPRRDCTPWGLAPQCEPLGRGADHMLSSAHVHMQGDAVISCDSLWQYGRPKLTGLLAQLVGAYGQ